MLLERGCGLRVVLLWTGSLLGPRLQLRADDDDDGSGDDPLGDTVGHESSFPKYESSRKEAPLIVRRARAWNGGG